MKKFWNNIKSYVYIIICVVLFRTFIATPAIVNGDSMYATLNDGEVIIINKVIKYFKNFERFEIVVIKNVEDEDRIIKRIIGLPNEKIEYKYNKLYINDEQVKPDISFEITDDFVYTTKDDEYFVMGDNRDISKDSRILGTFKKDDIIGRVGFVLYPFNKIGFVK